MRRLIGAGSGYRPTFPGAENPPDYIGTMAAWFDRHLPQGR